jgi:hypothetical protein
MTIIGAGTRRVLAAIVLLAAASYGRATAQTDPLSACKARCDEDCADKSQVCNSFTPIYDGGSGSWTGDCKWSCKNPS